ncbi:MAG: cell division protein ZapA [Hyphomicrobiales bacterium]
MGQVAITLNGRAYRLECDNGEEDRLRGLAAELDEHVERLKQQFGQVGDDRLLVMAALMIGDELAETRLRLDEANAKLADIFRSRAAEDQAFDEAQAEAAETIASLAERVEELTAAMAPEAERE